MFMIMPDLLSEFSFFPFTLFSVYSLVLNVNIVFDLNSFIQF